MEESRNADLGLGRMKIEATDHTKKYLLIGAITIGVLAAVWMASFVPNADWHGTFEPATRGIFQWRSPYEQPLFTNPPWAVLIFFPFVLFPSNIARGLVLVTSVGVLIYTAWRLNAPKFALIALLLSPTAIGSLLAANLDAYVLAGIFFPPVWGLFALMIKPQIGFGVAVYYLTQAWQNQKWIGIIRTFGPIFSAAVISGILFPIWLERSIHMTSGVWNRSIFPFGIPVGLFFLWLAIKRKNVFFALASTPFLTPYLTFYTYLVVQVGLLHEDVEKVIRRDVLQIILCVFLWTIMLLFRL
jgi:hypothetical protein